MDIITNQASHPIEVCQNIKSFKDVHLVKKSISNNQSLYKSQIRVKDSDKKHADLYLRATPRVRLDVLINFKAFDRSNTS